MPYRSPCRARPTTRRRWRWMAGVVSATLVVMPSVAAADSPPPPLEAIFVLGLSSSLMPAVRGPARQLEPAPVPTPAPSVDDFMFDPTAAPTPAGGFAPAGLDNCAEMHWYRVDAGLPAIFDKIGWHESNCRNEDGVHTFCCVGYWQLYVSMHLRSSTLGPRYRACGVNSASDVNSDTPADKKRQACAAKALYDVNGTSPWRATR